MKVSNKLKMGLLSTGSELVGPGQRPEGAHIRNSNSYQLAAQVRRAGQIPVDMGMVEDNAERIAERISVAMFDRIMLCGSYDVDPGY